MTKNVTELALQAIEYDKKLQQLKFNETLEGRKRRTKGDLSIAADRGLIKVIGNSSSLGYNSKMKIINDRLSTKIMNKYKNNFVYKTTKNDGREFINKDTIKMIK